MYNDYWNNYSWPDATAYPQSYGLKKMCIYHNNPEIVGQCITCGRFLCKDCVVPTRVGCVCPDCMKNDILRKKANYHRFKNSTVMTTVMGVLLSVLVTCFAVYIISYEIKADPEGFFAELNETGKWILVVAIFMFLIEMIATSGLFFGIKQVMHWFSSMPAVVVVFSFIFCAVIVTVVLQIAYWIGWFYMFKSWRDLRKMKEDYEYCETYLNNILRKTINFKTGQ